MCSVLETINKGFVFVGTAKTAAEIKHCIIVIQRQSMQKFFQLLESIANLNWITFVGLCIGLIKLI